MRKKNDYYNFIREFTGHYPVSLRTDGYGIWTEYCGQQYDQYVFEGAPISRISRNDQWPSWAFVNKKITYVNQRRKTP